MPRKGFMFTCYGIDYFVPTTRERISNRFAEKIIRKIATKVDVNSKNILNLQQKAIRVEIKDGCYQGTKSDGMMISGNVGNDRESFIELEVN